MATTMYGRINEFEAHNEDWETYVERVEMFFELMALKTTNTLPSYCRVWAQKRTDC